MLQVKNSKPAESPGIENEDDSHNRTKIPRTFLNIRSVECILRARNKILREKKSAKEQKTSRKVEEKIRKYFSEISIHKWKNVKDIELNESNATDKCLKAITSQIQKNIQNLDSLKLNMDWSPYLTDYGLKDFGLKIERHFAGLRKLSLEFYGCTALTEFGIEWLVLGIKKELKNLQELNLNFGECDIRNHGVMEAVPFFGKQSRYLQRLSLNFEQYSSLTYTKDAILKGLGYKLAKSVLYLKELSLNFSGSVQITDDGVIVLGKQIANNLKELQQLTLNFSKCPQISEDSVKVLAREIRNGLTHIQKLTLYFPRVNASADYTERIKAQFDQIPDVKLYFLSTSI